MALTTQTPIDLRNEPKEAPVRPDQLTTSRRSERVADWIWGLTRIALGWIFLWPFLDKTFGLGYATASEDAWIDGGSPTAGFLNFGTRGPFAEFFQSFAGDAWADWLFMGGLLAIGVALILGVGVRIAAAAGGTMLMMMWLAALAPEHNPIIDEHVIYAIVLVGLAFANAGDHLGLGRWWNRQDVVGRFPTLR